MRGKRRADRKVCRGRARRGVRGGVRWTGRRIRFPKPVIVRPELAKVRISAECAKKKLFICLKNAHPSPYVTNAHPEHECAARELRPPLHSQRFLCGSGGGEEED